MNQRTDNNPTCPGPGVYRDVPAETYFSWDALNNTGIGRLLRSPAHYQAGMEGEDDETAAKARGTICHAGIWEPARFDAEYAIGPDVKLNTKEGKTEWAAFVDANPGKVHVRGADGAAMLGCRRSIWAHPYASKLLSDPGPCEVSLVWDDLETGVRCKARIDKLAESASFAIDLKTTTDARPEAFRREVGEYDYHRQGTWYLHGLAALGLAFDNFAIIAAEKVRPPYAVTVLEMDQDDMVLGWADCLEAMRLYRVCRDLGEWPPYKPDPQPIGLPAWRRNQILETA